MGIREWKLVVKNVLNGTVDKMTERNLHVILARLLTRMKALNAVECFKEYHFVQTTNPFTGEYLYKTCVWIVNCPYTVFELKKQTKGSINQEEFVATLNMIKEKYCERD